ncbi:HAMP domain-containing sensor histidine kinase [Desulfosporosinus shakirovi]|uniref:HAMP domain-containing sensor histidine kinase n=1 Tax=Desulfosporosinus shakirovi TaxID=2885154 RepID=UPI001E28732E|nr:HAMP domain-containing sensor histidine kinase [Desulfosporosinus sp. SRJS8]MCB8816121.1 HAMP domain-containing histidine kinase [Desulfosporosinus sp. SRJS8]
MDIKWRRYSHSLVTKAIVFIITVLCFTSAFTIFLNIALVHRADFDFFFENSYYEGNDYRRDSSEIVESLRKVQRYKSEQFILTGGTLTEEEIQNEESNLFREFEYNSRSYNPNLTIEENFKTFKEVYADKILQAKDNLIKNDLNDYHLAMQRLANYQGLLYYANSGGNEFTNSPDKAKNYFKSHPAYMIFDGSEQEIFPREINDSRDYYWVSASIDQIGLQDIMYIAFTEDYLNSKILEWKENKLLITNGLYQITGFLLGFAATFIYLLLVTGRKPNQDQEVQLNFINRIYNDFNIGMCIVLIALWVGAIDQLENLKSYKLIFPITLPIVALVCVLVLSLVKHLKNRTFIKHTLTYSIFHKLFKFINDIYNSGSMAVKVVLIVIGYPVIVAITFFMFPITLGVATWLAFKKVKEFNAIKDGVKRVKDGDIHYTINVAGEGELAKLAADINSITDGLYKAVESETKSERLKAELITNVSHDIRTPLTSIITYVDLLKQEKDQTKVEEYLEIIDQKSQRLKVLTEDLFEAAKASSGTILVNFDKIDLLSLITQGLGELDDKIQESKLEFKLSHSNDKVYIKADGKLLWRAIENLLSNIFKYALEGSRVYIDIIDTGTGVTLIIKNISAYELNISSDELMERFKRGDEARSSQGSGLGLSIAKSLMEVQKGSFNIEIDGDLFKAVIQMTKAELN